MGTRGSDQLEAFSGAPHEATFENRVRSGTRWVIVAQVGSQLVSLVVLGVLYHLVAPDQFGLLGMAVPFLLLAKTLSAFGLHVATVQRPDLTSGQLSTVFWASLLVSLVIAILVAAGAPLVALLYQAPALRGVLAALAGTLFVTACGAQHQALLERKLQIGRVAALRLIAQIAGGTVAVLAAWALQSVWALVVQQYVELVVLALLAWWWEPWRPSAWRRGESARELLQFGGFYASSGLLFYVAQNVDKILLGWLLGATQAGHAAVGFYSQAFNLMMKPVSVVASPITGIMLPALSRSALQPQLFTPLVARFFRMVGILLFPCGVGLIVVAMDVVLVLGGTPWRGAGLLLLILAPVVLVQGLINICGSVFAASGHARALSAGAAAMALWMVACCTTGLWLGRACWPAPEGPTWGVAAGFVAGTLLVAVPYWLFCFHTAQVSPAVVLAPLLRAAVAALAMGLVAAAASALAHQLTLRPVLRLALVVPVGVVTYLFVARGELTWLRTHLRHVSEEHTAPG